MDGGMVYKSTLKTLYGLTPAMIRELGEPDKQVANPHYPKAAPPASLYLVERVERWIDNNLEWVREAAEKRAARSARATAAHERRRAETVAWAESVEIQVGYIPGDIWRRAELYYQEVDYERGNYDRAGQMNLNGVIAYLRHRETNYEALLARLEGRVGAFEGYSIIHTRVNELIAERLAEMGMTDSEPVRSMDLCK